MNTAAQPVQQIVVQGYQPTAVNANYQNNAYELQKLRHIYNLAIVEVVLGGISMFLGIVLLLVGISLAEGIWCGFFIVLAGGFGIAAGKPTSTKCMVITHMALAIVGSLFAATMFSFSVIFSFQIYYSANFALHVVLDLIAFMAMVIQIVSACYCCCVKDGCNAQGFNSAQMIVVQQQQPVPVVQTGAAGVVVYQQQQPIPIQQQNIYANQQPPMYSNQGFQQQDEKAGGFSPSTNPPAYE